MSMPSAGMRARVVDELRVHGAPIDFRELCIRTIPSNARTLLLDLDRTVHLGRNMGELLGWEICALHGYGPERLAELERSRGRGRFLVDWSSPQAVFHYMKVGVRMWAMPGLYYLLWGKLAWENTALRRLSFRMLGPEPVRTAQRVPQTALMHHMAELPLSTLRDLAARVFRRYASEQVILREDLTWLRRRCPSLRVVLTSASPQPMVEVAAEELGVDDVVYSTIEEHEGWLSAPAERRRMYLPSPLPRRISPPGALRINASHAKIDAIARRDPSVFSPDTPTVGMTDTGYGEDHCWAQHLGSVVDVNSTAPFPPIVDARSPLRVIHSALVLTRSEREARDVGMPRLDPRRATHCTHDPMALDKSTLELELSDTVMQVSALMERLEVQEQACAADREHAEQTLREVEERIAQQVDRYNEEAEGTRSSMLRHLDALDHEALRVRRALARALQPVGEVAHALAQALAASRSRVEALLERRLTSAPVAAATA